MRLHLAGRRVDLVDLDIGGGARRLLGRRLVTGAHQHFERAIALRHVDRGGKAGGAGGDLVEATEDSDAVFLRMRGGRRKRQHRGKNGAGN